MCLGIPGRIVRWINRDRTFAQAEVQFDGVTRVCHLACVREAEPGDYVIVHAGVAISRIDAGEANRIFEALRCLDEGFDWRDEVQQ